MHNYDALLEWRITIFSAIKNVYQSYESNQVAALHDTPWTVLHMAKSSRKKSFQETCLSKLGRLRNSTTMVIKMHTLTNYAFLLVIASHMIINVYAGRC
jgi:hypothetical protein